MPTAPSADPAAPREISAADPAVVARPLPGQLVIAAGGDSETAQKAAFSPFSEVGVASPLPHAPERPVVGTWSPSVIAVLAGAVCITKLFRLLVR